MSERNPTTMREALVAQQLMEADELITRIESLHESSKASIELLNATVDAVKGASVSYRTAVAEFSHEAARSLETTAQKIAFDVISDNEVKIREIMTEAARVAFVQHASRDAELLAKQLREASVQFQRATWSRLAETVVISFFAFGLSLSAVWIFLRQ